ncbi:MAG TPA: BTAD domain-containing putative transcriptional regulator [Aquihabitans sp.]|nr:BTAD domain-containing putative transcriptional regulator [Aquihabitans sp.]
MPAGPGPRTTPAVTRDRLLPLLRERFDRRIIAIAAGAGFGKSTLLAQAVAENAIEHLGVDALVRVDERDRAAERLCRRIGEALDAPTALDDPADLVELIWSRAPTSVAVLIDDAHVLGDAPEPWAVLDHLLVHLPRNGHLVVCGRRAPRLALASWRAREEALVLGEDELRFDADELARFGALHDLAPELVDDLPPWPALAALTGRIGTRASMAFLWEEVLADLDDRRRRLLAAVAPLGLLDDELVAALGDDQLATVDALVEDLPLVERASDGTARLHDLWGEALAAEGGPEVDRLRCAAGDLLAERGDLALAAEAYALADAHDRFEGLVLRVAHRPSMWTELAEIGRILDLLPAPLRARPSGRYLEAARAWASDERLAIARFRAVADEAAAAGEGELEALARWRVLQFEDLDIPGGPTESPMLTALVDADVPLAGSVLAFLASRRAQTAGDVEASIEALAGLDQFDEDQRANAYAIRMIDLGRPEAVPATLDSVLEAGLDNIYEAQAVWLQGAIDPTAAWPIARTIADRLDGAMVTLRTSTLCVLTSIALAAGDEGAAQAMAAEARRLAPLGPRTIELFAEVAAALVDLCVEGEAPAVERLGALLDDIPLGRWPERPYLYALAAIRALVPGGDALDGCSFGPSMATAVEAGAALVALRAGDAGPASRLRWDAPDLLRVHVPPPLLVELAVAVDDPRAAALLPTIAHLRRWLGRVVERGAAPAAPAAAARLSVLPARPAFDLTVRVLGDLDIERSDGASTEGWDRRERVRQLLAYLVLHRRAARSEVATALWPDLPPEKAAANLRVNLAHLQAALHPDRRDDERPWFVDTTGSRLALTDRGLTTDLDLHDRAVAEAVAAEAAGLPSRALEHYRRAIDLYRGPLLADLDVAWAELERIRLQSSAHGAVARVGELLLARGEPEQAMHLAVRAQQLDPLSERAQRLFIRCHLALGSTSSARAAGARLVAELADAGMRPDRETELLLAGLPR